MNENPVNSTSSQTIKVYRDILEVNAEWAAETRKLAAQHRVTLINLIGGPGCGKTRLLESMVGELGRRFRFCVLEGDPETSRDAERLHALGIPVSQLITGGGCHLSAQMVHTAFKDLPLADLDVVIIENVGNLMCPACFDVGENAKVAALSITEGEDKPLKYPLLFQQASAVLLTKADLLPYLRFDVAQCETFIHQVNGKLPIFTLSANSGAGMPAWCDWLQNLTAQVRAAGLAHGTGN